MSVSATATGERLHGAEVTENHLDPTTGAVLPDAAEQRDEADEGRVKVERSMEGVSCHEVAATKDHRGVVRPSQLIASVRPTRGTGRGGKCRSS